MDRLKVIERIENGTEYKILEEYYLFMTRDRESDEVHVYGLFGDDSITSMYVGTGQLTMKRVIQQERKRYARTIY